MGEEVLVAGRGNTFNASNAISELTDDQIKEISDTVNESVSNSITATTMKKAEEEKQRAIENGEIKNHSDIVAIDRETGRPLTAEEYQTELDKIDKEIESDDDELQSWDEMLADDNIEGFSIDEKSITVTKDTIIAELQLLFPKATLYDDDYQMVFNAVDKYRVGLPFSYFKSFPPVLQEQIKDMLKIPADVYTEQSRTILNEFAKNLLSNLIQSQYMESINDTFQENIKKLSAENGKYIEKDAYWTYVRTFFNHILVERIKEYEEKEDIEKAEKCRGIYYAFKESYNFSIMKDLYKNTGKLKVKSIMLEKFDRTCNEFNSQYKNHQRTIINVKQLVKALDRTADKKFDLDVIKEFICVFIKYTQYKNMSPNNIADHTFMYYFIFNILTVNTCNPEIEEDVQFRDQLINNINEFLQLIVDKRKAKERKK